MQLALNDHRKAINRAAKVCVTGNQINLLTGWQIIQHND